LEFYTFVADNYAPFYSLPTECTDRDAAFVLDGLLYNESELQIFEPALASQRREGDGALPGLPGCGRCGRRNGNRSPLL
jgi:TnpA family transposase